MVAKTGLRQLRQNFDGCRDQEDGGLDEIAAVQTILLYEMKTKTAAPTSGQEFDD